MVLKLPSPKPYILTLTIAALGFPRSSVGKESACNAGDLDSIPALGRSPREGNGNPLQYPCLENPMDRGAWRATVLRVARVRHDLANKPPPLLLWSSLSELSEMLPPGLQPSLCPK